MLPLAPDAPVESLIELDVTANQAWQAHGKLAMHTCGACTATRAGHACIQLTVHSWLKFILRRVLLGNLKCAHLLHHWSQKVLYCQLRRTRLYNHQLSRRQVRHEAAWQAHSRLAVHTCGACTATCAGHACKQDTS